MNIVAILPDGVGVRNFVVGPFSRDVSGTDDLVALHAIPEAQLPIYLNAAGRRARWERLRPYREGVLAGTSRYALSYAHMYWADTRAMRFSLRSGGRTSWRSRAMHNAARLAGRMAATPRGIRHMAQLHNALVRRLPVVADYVELFKRLQTDVLFCSHQRPPIAIPAVVAARALAIPAATFIFSWDNLSGKGRIAAPFDHYMVWSDHMKSELRRFYPDVPAERVHVVGTPQFDFYADPSLQWSRSKFFAEVKADPSRPLICYSGGDAGNSPEDPAHVRILLEHIRSGRIRRSAQVLLRPAPVDRGTRFDAVRRDFPELIFARPEWVHTATHNWDQVLPLPSDAEFLTNLTRHADVNVNLGSTMTLDFALRDKPVVNIAFDVASPPPFGTALWDHHYRFEHYQPVIAFKAARFARSAEQLAEQIEGYLDDPALDREGRRRLVDLQLGVSPGDSTSRLIDVLRRVAGTKSRPAQPVRMAEASVADFGMPIDSPRESDRQVFQRGAVVRAASGSGPVD